MLNSKGESLVEVIVSLVLFILLLATVTSMIQSSLGVLTKTYENNKNLSNSISNIENNVDLTEGGELTFSFEISGGQYGVPGRTVNIPVTLKKSGGIKIYED